MNHFTADAIRIILAPQMEMDCEPYAPNDRLGDPYRVIFGFAIFATALIAFLLNLFVIITLCVHQRNQRRRFESNRGTFETRLTRVSRVTLSNTHKSFISLSISVIIYSSICVPAMYLQTIDNGFTSNQFVIYALMFCFYVSPIASSFMHLLMAIDR